jgi:hypothetical protein
MFPLLFPFIKLFNLIIPLYKIYLNPSLYPPLSKGRSGGVKYSLNLFQHPVRVSSQKILKQVLVFNPRVFSNPPSSPF